MSKMSTDACPAPEDARRRALSGPTMGTRWSATFQASEGFGGEALAVALQRAVDDVDQQMSNWKPDSDLSRLNAAPVGAWVDVPCNLLCVLSAGLAVGRASGGAFDIGVGDLVHAWGFGPGSRVADTAVPGGSARRSCDAPSFRSPPSLQLDEAGCRARKLQPAAIDLSGIAKGYGVDELAGVMDAAGIGSWLVGIDGEMRAQGRKPNGRPWAVAVEKPEAGVRDTSGVLELTDCAVATSGTYRHGADVDGLRVSHTMDPRARRPAAGDLLAVTVLAKTCMLADAWATALLVEGSDAGPRRARTEGLAALFMMADGTLLSTL
jgi:thiamine biosynthesis lipoprotein